MLADTILRNDKKFNHNIKRLMVCDNAAREAFNEEIIDYIIWIRRMYNLVDAMTEIAILPEFVEAIEKKQLYYELGQSVKRTIDLSSDVKEKVLM